jgi:hypothetical protein
MLETTIRVVDGSEKVAVALGSIGQALSGNFDASEALIKLAGGLDEFNSKVSFFSENFLSEAERLAPVQSNVVAQLKALGLSSVDTRDEFKRVVQAMDLSTEAGREVYSTLMDLAPAFAKIYEETDTAADKLNSLREEAVKAYERESTALEGTINSIDNTIKSLADFKTSLTLGSNSTLTPQQKYQEARIQASALASMLSSSDIAQRQEAANKLPSVVNSLLSSSRTVNASSALYSSDFSFANSLIDSASGALLGAKSEAQQQLDVLNNSYGSLNVIEENTRMMAEIMPEFLAASTTQEDNLAELKAFTEELRLLREQQAKESEEAAKVGTETVRVLKGGFLGLLGQKVTVTTSTSTTPTAKQTWNPDDPGYHIWGPGSQERIGA